MGGRQWQRHEVKFLRDNALLMTAAQIGEHLNREEYAVYRKAGALGISLGKPGVTAKISDEDRYLCLALRQEGLKYPVIAEKMELAISTVWRICNPSTSPKISRHDVWLTRELWKNGMQYAAIAEKMELSTTTVWRICNLKGKYANYHAQQG